MKIIYRIARLELSILFYSPIAWLVLIIFVLQAGIKFTEIIELLEGFQQRGIKTDNLTARVFSGGHREYNLFAFLKNNFYLYIPLLTMGLISREFSSGSVKLLLSSPVNFSQIVLGKYLAMVVYSLILCAVLGLFMLAGAYSIVSLDYMLVFSGIMGLFLLICAYSAIGLFISGLTSYQVVAAVGTFAVITLLNFIGELWQGVPVINEIVYWLSISGRADQMISGLISSKVVLYFLIVILLFITLTVLKLSSGRYSWTLVTKLFGYGVVLSITIVFGYITSRPSLTVYYDMTNIKSETLTPESQEVVALFQDHPIKITSYVNIFSALVKRSGTPKHHNQNFRHLEKYVRFLPKLEMEYVYFYDTIPSNPDIYKNNMGLSEKELAQKVAASFGLDFDEVLSPEEIRKIIDLSSEGNQYVRLIEYNGKKTFLRMFDDTSHYPKQEEISAALKRLVRTPPNVAFVSGHGERTFAKNDQDYRSAVTGRASSRKSLINKGFDATRITLEASKIPEEVSILVIADPKSAFTKHEIETIKEYIDRGGNLLVMAEPENRTYLDSLMVPLGVGFVSGQLKQKGKDFLPDFIQGKVPESALMLSQEYRYNRRYVDKDRPVSMPGAMALAHHPSSPFEAIPLIVTNKNTFNDFNGGGQKHLYTLTSFDSQLKSELPIAMALKRKVRDKEQRIVVVGDADFMSNSEWKRSNVYTQNRRGDFIAHLFHWLSNEEFSVNSKYPSGKDNCITIDAAGIGIMRNILVVILPGLLITFGTVVLAKRRRK
ncbi:Gldg family protein [Fulvivirgaceae bacterium BMA12]|uniref:Gldg family protein n=1 Tax=Agaribacillus aureus TaxID=3051825 RepID=A0ABT8L3Z5_9BACT|nr:Gldg family protein [Fulvivirgaceae bacterium BMA12]